jgi:hypothetical protein
MSPRQILLPLIRRSPLLARVAALRALARDSELHDSGWFRSRASGLPVDAQGAPLPWYTYAAIHFLAGRLDARWSVFEYGSGNSTLWWAARVARVVSCEHDFAWHARLRPQLPAQVDYRRIALEPSAQYAGCVAEFPGQFEVVVLDGRERVACSRHAPAGLAPGGVIIWDNSERDEYRPGCAGLAAAGFRRLDFRGLGPINTYGWCTSVFYRPDNVLGI